MKFAAALCLTGAILGAAPACAQDGEDRTLDAMSRRGLAESAVLYAESQFKHAIDPSLQAKWTMRLMESHAMAALHSTSGAGQADSAAELHWAAPDNIYQRIVLAQPENPRLPWLAWQNARCDLLHAQATLAGYLAVPADQRLRESALNWVREVMSKSEQLLEDIQRRQPLAARQSRQGGSEAPAEQLAKLSIDTALLQCDALLVRARLYEPGSSDSIAAATEVDKRAEEVFSRSSDEWATREQLIAARAVAQLELGKADQALRVLEGLARDSANPQTRIRAAMIAIERLASEGATSRAQPLLTHLEKAGAGAELALARLQLALADVPASSPEAKQRALNQLVNQAKQIGNEHGDYWRNRAEALLVGAVSSTSVENSTLALDLMLVEVRQLLANDDSAAAIQKLLQFRNNEAAAGRGANAIQLASKAWALLGREGQWAEAAAALQPTLEKFPNATGAAEAHLFVISAREQMLRSDVKNSAYAAAYEDALRNQLQTWPDAIVSDESEAMLAKWLLQQGKRVEYLGILQMRWQAALEPEVVRRSTQQWLEQVLQLSGEVERLLAIERLRAANPKSKPAELATSTEVALLVAEAFSSWPTGERASAIQQQLAVLRRQLPAPAQLPADDSSAEPSAALDQQLILAAELLHAIRGEKRDLLPNLLAAWKPSDLPAGLRLGLTQAWVDAIDQTALPQQRGWIDGLKVDEAWVAALGDSPNPIHRAIGQRFVAWQTNASEGLSGLEKLCGENPRDGNLRLQLAQALVASGLNRLPESTMIAKQIAASSAPASELNLAARWRIVRNALLGGDGALAAQSARIVLATLPEEDTIWRQRFESAAK